jgi:para-aminobenzoate synthetase component 1
MQRIKEIRHSFQPEELPQIKRKMLNWLQPFSIFTYLDNNSYNNAPNRFEILAGAGMLRQYNHLPDSAATWLMGHFSYDYKNQVEPGLKSRHPNLSGFAECLFYEPAIVAYVAHGSAELVIQSSSHDPQHILQQLLDSSEHISTAPLAQQPEWQYFFEQDQYLDCVNTIREHIAAGDCYEMNFCTGATAQLSLLDPIQVFSRLNTISPAPFAALYRNENAWLMCASPERFLFRASDTVLSQPIKGTARRAADPSADQQLKAALLADEKERAENVMIVDLVRNDLAKSCEPGTVSVPELFGIYSFPQVHQMISTVSGKIRSQLSLRRIIDNAFPMGSMTGAPKYIVMELTDQYERSRRGIYAGALGYVMPGGDFDFNVVIRSLQYNAGNGRLCYQTGGAITYDSLPEREWEETRLKARALEQVFVS